MTVHPLRCSWFGLSGAGGCGRKPFGVNTITRFFAICSIVPQQHLAFSLGKMLNDVESHDAVKGAGSEVAAQPADVQPHVLAVLVASPRFRSGRQHDVDANRVGQPSHRPNQSALISTSDIEHGRSPGERSGQQLRIAVCPALEEPLVHCSKKTTPETSRRGGRTRGDGTRCSHVAGSYSQTLPRCTSGTAASKEQPGVRVGRL